jgi:hypothetical protein
MRRLLLLLIFAGCHRSNPGYLGDGFLPFDLGVGDSGNNGGDGGGSDGGNNANVVAVSVAQRDTVDILFMLDNSPTMAAKQKTLQTALPGFWAALMTAPAAAYHIGVITSDLGAGQFTIGSQCKPGGDGAKMQAIGAAADVSCKAPVGANYLIVDQRLPSDNLPAGQTVEQTLTCMTSVGNTGCGFESQLEAPLKALSDATIVENGGFLRADALLAVVLVTDGDDCSADPSSDVFDPSKTQYGQLSAYRCYNYGVMCGSPATLMPYAASGGPLTMCRGATAAAGGKLFEMHRFVDFFTKPTSAGGVKDDSNAVLLEALAGPSTPVETILAVPTTSPWQTCAGPPSTSCYVETQHSCLNASDATVSGDPAVRIDELLRNVAQHDRGSICDGDFSAGLSRLANMIAASRLGGCIGGVIDATAPRCSVMVNGVPISQCGTAGVPCWRVQAQSGCTYGDALTIDSLQAGSIVQASCQVK